MLAWVAVTARAANPSPPKDAAAEYAAHVRPMMAQYCLSCHSQKAKKGDLNLERFATVDEVRKDVRPWQDVLEKLESGEMPPKKAAAQPTPDERQRLAAWVRDFLAGEAVAGAGDPGRVVVRRLSNAEYDYTVRDLTGVDLRPTRDFPTDGAAGEGFTNAGDALVMSPTLLTKYLNAAKGIAAHAVLLPDGFRFSRAATGRDRTDEVRTELAKAYREYNRGRDDGLLDFTPFLAAAVAYRDNLTSGKITIEAVAAKENLNPKYLHVLWQTLNDPAPSFPLDEILRPLAEGVAEGRGGRRLRRARLANAALEVQQDRQLHEPRLAGRQQSALCRGANAPIQAAAAAGTERSRRLPGGPRPDGPNRRPRRMAPAAVGGRQAAAVAAARRCGDRPGQDALRQGFARQTGGGSQSGRRRALGD